MACGYYKDGHEIKAGNPLEFYIGIDLFYRFKNNVRLGFGIFHISNADSGYRNPGSETLVLKYQIPFGKVNSIWYGLIVKLDITNPS